MAYISIDDIKSSRIAEARLIQLTDETDLGVVDEAKVNEAIAGAGEIFDGFIRGKYPLPLAEPVPGIVRTINLDLTTYAIYGLNPDFEMPKTVDARYATALKLLERLQDDKMKLYEDVPEVSVETPTCSEVLPGTRTFSRENLKGF
jgi:phage gp36-like protein